MTTETERRDFMKLTGATLGGMAVATLTTSEAAAQGYPRPRRLTIYAQKNVTLEALIEALKDGLGKTSCPNCGLLGLDISAIIGDPPEVINVKTRGVNGVTLGGATEGFQ